MPDAKRRSGLARDITIVSLGTAVVLNALGWVFEIEVDWWRYLRIAVSVVFTIAAMGRSR